jgi:hypothetical protein
MNYDTSYTPLVYESKYDCSNIVLIDNNVEDYKYIISSLNSDTMAIVYSYSSTKEDLSNVLTNFVNINRIAFVFCGNSNNAPVPFLDNETFFSSDNISFLINIYNKYNVSHADYLACNTLNYELWINYYNTLTENTSTTIGASDNKTGNIKYGGDWILENTSNDIENIYFTQNIKYYEYLLDNAIWASGNSTSGIYTPAGITSYNNNIYVANVDNNNIIQIPINANGTAGTQTIWYTHRRTLYSIAAYNGFIYTARQANETGSILRIPINTDGTAGTANRSWIESIVAPSHMIGYNSVLFTAVSTVGIMKIPINADDTAGTMTTWYNQPTVAIDISNSILYATLANTKGIVIIPIINGSAGTPTIKVTNNFMMGIAIYSSYLYSNNYTTSGTSYIVRMPINSNGSLGTSINWKATSNSYMMEVRQNPAGVVSLYETHLNNNTISTFDLYIPPVDTSNTSTTNVSDTNTSTTNVSDTNTSTTNVSDTSNSSTNVSDTSNVSNDSNASTRTPVLSNICFLKGTPVLTDQGIIEIQNITSNNTINNKKVKHITITTSFDEFLICIEKDSLRQNIPNERIIISKNHKILYNNKFIKALDLPNVNKIPYNGEILYNVLLEENGVMIVNNVICETLNINNVIAHLYNSSNIDKITMLLNKTTNMDEYKKIALTYL